MVHATEVETAEDGVTDRPASGLGDLARTFFRFGLVGCSGMGVDLLALMLLRMCLPFAMARGVAIWFAMTWNFLLNRRFTFAAARDESALRQYPLYCGSGLGGALVSW